MDKIITLAIAGIIALLLTLPRPHRVHAEDLPSAQEMIALSDQVRNPGQPFRLTSTLTEYVDGKPRDHSGVVVYAKIDKDSGQFKNIVGFVDPPRDLGKLVLFQGTKLWFYDPASKASVPISPQQRLIGQASDGDVLTVNLAKDYTGKLVGEEKLLDADRKERDCVHLDMPASNDEAVYSHVEYWLEKGTYHPVKAKFYSDSGRVLKIAYFRRYQTVLDGLRPTETIIIDAVNSNLVTTVDTSDYRWVDIPESWFQRDYLPRVKVE